MRRIVVRFLGEILLIAGALVVTMWFMLGVELTFHSHDKDICAIGAFLFLCWGYYLFLERTVQLFRTLER